MQSVRFGSTGTKVSRLGLGTMSLGSSAWKGWVKDEADAAVILRRALDLGINFYDMADWYSTGLNEQVVGRTLLGLEARERLVLATKVFYPMSDDPNDCGLSRQHILTSIDRSLQRLGTDHVDLYIVHAFDPETPIEETMRALDDVVRAGKALYLGASTMYAWQLAEMNALARANGWTQFVNMQCQLSLLYREEEREMLPYCEHAGLAVTTFSPLARGYLAGAAPNARTAHDAYLEWFGDEIDREIARRVQQLAERRGVTASAIAMAWVCAHRQVTVPLIGADTPEQVEAAVAAADLVLDEDERAFLEAPYRPRDMINDYNPVRRARALGAEDRA
jgi:aryl-alcohol dehydrogenase-like predicted oxidoreductase